MINLSYISKVKKCIYVILVVIIFFFNNPYFERLCRVLDDIFMFLLQNNNCYVIYDYISAI